MRHTNLNGRFKADLFNKDGTIASPYCLQSLKLFAEFIGKSTPGILDPSGKPTVQTVRNHFRNFVSGWNLEHPESIISYDHKTSVTNISSAIILLWLLTLTSQKISKQGSKKKLGLSEMTRPKTFLTLEIYIYLERQLWENDSHDYVHEAYRVFISTKLKCHLYTPARLGEVSEGSTRRNTGKGLRYKVRNALET